VGGYPCNALTASARPRRLHGDVEKVVQFAPSHSCSLEIASGNPGLDPGIDLSLDPGIFGSQLYLARKFPGPDLRFSSATSSSTNARRVATALSRRSTCAISSVFSAFVIRCRKVRAS
jgi:hypothetical protein